MKILVTSDYDPSWGFFWKEDLLTRLRSLNFKPVLSCQDISVALEQLAEVVGILIPGGLQDIPPEAYGERPHPKSLINSVRYEFEKPLIEASLKKNLPILGICWGMQALNVALGGSLHQHLPDEEKFFVSHEQAGPKHLPTHKVSFLKKERAEKLFGRSEMKVNSTHHQAVKSLGKGLEVEALAEDSLIEAISLPTQSFVWGVEWHPERLDDDPIIPAFAKACQR
ncbi:MAG: gamma-glutamyl-gamma-aminobutyrate hydrolase family protein [Bradymonadales bacterium]|nr:MAG: gamma-glutamyl-gamma-aminobutyrate hydrolase family protein [Bradymonadales bacterium]